jgi:hypothetical protein
VKTPVFTVISYIFVSGGAVTNLRFVSSGSLSLSLSLHAPIEDKIDDMKDSFYKELECVFDKLHKYHMNTFLGDLNAKERKPFSHQQLEMENLHEIVRIIIFATSKNLTLKGMMFPHCNIHKYTWTTHGEAHNQIDHILIGDGIEVYNRMSSHSGRQIVLLTTICWWQKIKREQQ